MIEIGPIGEGVVKVRHSGMTTNSDFAALAATVANYEPRCGMLIYFDWLDVSRWEFSGSKVNATSSWRGAAKRIARVAIVHDHRLNPQAAWLAAVLRGEGVTVRSWCRQDAVLAGSWLVNSSTGIAPSTFRGSIKRRIRR
jgi:hypothetical protein